MITTCDQGPRFADHIHEILAFSGRDQLLNSNITRSSKPSFQAQKLGFACPMPGKSDPEIFSQMAVKNGDLLC